MTWNLNPLIAAALLLPLWAYAHGVMVLWHGGVGRGVARHQVALFLLGVFTLFIALMSPVDTVSEELLSTHMVQHVLLMIVAPPLLVLGATPSIFLWVLPLRWRRTLGRWTAPRTRFRSGWRAISAPFTVWSLHAAAIWLWHLPGLYQAALIHPLIHWFEHAAFFGTGLLFWHTALHDKQRLVGVLLIFTTALHSSILGALMTFAGSVWYPLYIERTGAWGLTALEDQQLAGLIMWIPAGIVYLIAAMWLLGTALQKMDNAEQRARTVKE